jgi:hypothetical protein
MEPTFSLFFPNFATKLGRNLAKLMSGICITEKKDLNIKNYN